MAATGEQCSCAQVIVRGGRGAPTLEEVREEDPSEVEEEHRRKGKEPARGGGAP